MRFNWVYIRLLYLPCWIFTVVSAYDYDDHNNPVTHARLKIAVLPEQSSVYKKVTQRLSWEFVRFLESIPRFQVMNSYLGIGTDMRKAQYEKDLMVLEKNGVNRVLLVSVNRLESMRHRNAAKYSDNNNGKFSGLPLELAAVKRRSRQSNKTKPPVTVIAEIQIKLLNLLDKKVEKSALFTRSATGKTRRRAIHQLIQSVGLEFKRYAPSLYLIETEVVKSFFDRVVLRLGADMGIRKGMRFLIRTRGRTEVVSGKKYEFKGENIAIVKVTEVGDSVSVAYIQRQWDRVNMLHQAVEMTKAPAGIRFVLNTGLSGGLLSLLGNMALNPLGRVNMTIGLGYFQNLDGGGNGIIGELGINARYPVARLFRIKPGIAYEFYTFIQDAEHSSTDVSLLHAVRSELCSEWVLSKHWNLDIGFGYTWRVNNRSHNDEEISNTHKKTSLPDVAGYQLRVALTYIQF